MDQHVVDLIERLNAQIDSLRGEVAALKAKERRPPVYDANGFRIPDPDEFQWIEATIDGRKGKYSWCGRERANSGLSGSGTTNACFGPTGDICSCDMCQNKYRWSHRKYRR